MMKCLKRLLSPIWIWLVMLSLPIPSYGADDVVVQFQWKHQFQFAGYYAALELGFYKEHGLNVTLREFDHGVHVADAVVSREAHFGVGRSAIAFEGIKERQILLLAAIYQHSPYVLMTLERSDLKEVSDLAGRRIMLADDKIAIAALTAMMVVNGVDLDSYTAQEHTFSVDDLVDGRTDAITAYTSNEPYQMEKQGIGYRIFAPRDHGFDFYSDILFTSQALHEEDPDLVARFRQATLQGYAYAFSHIDELVELILRKYNTQNRSREALVYEAEVLRALAQVEGTPLGAIAEDRIRLIIQAYRLLGITKEAGDIDGLVYKPTEPLGAILSREGPQFELSLSEEEKQWLRSHPVIKVHNEWNWPPFNFNKDGLAQGYSIDYMNLLADRIGVRIRYIPGEWGELLGMAFSKELDVMLNIVKTSERQKHLLFVGAYARNPNVIVVGEESAVSDMGSLSGRKVAYPEGFFYDEILRNEFPDVIRAPMKDTLASLKALQFGQVEAVLGELAVVRYIIGENLLTGLSIGGAFESGDPEVEKLNMAVRNDWPILATILRKAMHSVTKEERARLIDKWGTGLGQTDRGPRADLTPEEREWIRQHPILRLGVDPSMPPFDFVDSEGRHSGIAADVLTRLEEILGIDLQLVPDLSWGEVKAGAKARELDVISLASETEDRREYLRWTSPYVTMPMVIAARTSFGKVNSLEDLVGHQAVVVKGYSIVAYLRENYPDLTFTEAETPLVGLRMVELGKAEAYIGYLGTISYLVREHGLYGIGIAGPTGFPAKRLAMAVRSDWPELVPLLNKGLAAIPRDEMFAIEEKWIPSLETAGAAGDESVRPTQVDFDETTFIIESIAIVFAIILTVLFVIWLIRGRPTTLTVREILFFVSFAFVGLIISIGVFVSMLMEGIKSDSEADSRLYGAYHLADELRGSSDDLTRMARLFAVTGDPAYESHFNTIIAIRDGKQARPAAHSPIYWDEFLAGQVSFDGNGETYSIEERILELGLTEEEQATLARAKEESDQLVAIEVTAFNAAKGLFKDENGEFTLESKPDLDLARRLLHGREYHEAKARIVAPINQFFTMLESRTTYEQNRIHDRNRAIILGITGLTLITICFAVYVFFLLKRRVVTPLSQLQSGAQAIERGHYAQHIDIDSQDEVGDLAQAFNSMAGGIERQTDELIEAQEHVQQLLEAAPDAFFSVDQDGKITLVNAQAEKLFGYGREKMIGSRVEMFLPPDLRERHVGHRTRFVENPRARAMGIDMNLEALHADGRTIPVEISLSPIETGQGMLTIAAVRDITDRREAEAELKRNMDALERFRKMAVGRETRMIRLKEEINGLLGESGREPKYKIVDKEEGQSE